MMDQNTKHRRRGALFIGASLFIASNLFSQGLPRSTGLGIRASYWKPNDPTAKLSVGRYSNTNLSGSDDGAKYYFFSRLTENWFLEASFGTDDDGGIHFTKKGSEGSYTGKTKVDPFMFGCRYDWLPPRTVSVIQPYVSGGVGLYWIKNNLTSSTTYATRVFNDSDLKVGMYLGTGMHIVLKSWFALNMDMKYHFVQFHPTRGYSGFQFGAGFCFMWGRQREMFRVEDVKIIVKDIYPVYYQFYNTYPLALVSIKNTVGYPIEINVRSEIQEYSERKMESGLLRIEPGEIKDVPVYAIFGPKLLQTSRREPTVIDFEVESRAGVTHKVTFSSQVMIHNRNAWNGEIDKLGLFVTPDEKTILEIGREVASQISDPDNSPIRSFLIGRCIFDELREMGIRYHRDPNIPFYKDDRVQFASETNDLKTGDCDDLVVYLASLFEGVGIGTAFVDVQDPKKDVAHVYLMFDTGLPPEKSSLISSTDKSFVIREKSSGKRTIWIPVETTLVEHGFEVAWNSGALQYLQDGIIRNGISEGWVKIINVK